MAPATPTHSEPKLFETGDRVFAKLRGYPAWPARIEGIAVQSPNPKTIRYNIFFYGTYQTGKCAGDQLFEFNTYQSKFGTPKSAKGFNQALDEIVNKPHITPPQPEESDPEEVEPEPTVTQPKSAKKKHAATSKDEPPTKKLKTKQKTPVRPSPKSSKTSPKSAAKSAFKVVFPSFKSPKSQKEKHHTDTDDTQSEDEFQQSLSNSLSSVKKEPAVNGQFENVNTEVKVQLSKRQINILLGLGMPEMLRGKLERYALEKAILGEMGSDNIDEAKKFLKAELELIDLTSELQTDVLTEKSKPDTTHVLDILDKLLFLPVVPLMLKKQPSLVETISSLQKYTGNVRKWKLDENEKAEFLVGAKVIREKAAQIMHRFVSLFEVPQNNRFLPWLLEQSTQLKKLVSPNHFPLMTLEPELVDLDTEDNAETTK